MADPRYREGAGSDEPARALLDVARDLQQLSDRHSSVLRDQGLDDLAERLEELVVVAETGAQELGAALEVPPGVSPADGRG